MSSELQPHAVEMHPPIRLRGWMHFNSKLGEGGTYREIGILYVQDRTDKKYTFITGDVAWGDMFYEGAKTTSEDDEDGELVPPELFGKKFPLHMDGWVVAEFKLT